MQGPSAPEDRGLRATATSSSCTPRATSTTTEEVEFGEVHVFTGPGYVDRRAPRRGERAALRARAPRGAARAAAPGPGGRGVGGHGQGRRRLRAGRRRGSRTTSRRSRRPSSSERERPDAAHLLPAPRAGRASTARCTRCCSRSTRSLEPSTPATTRPSCATTCATSTTTSGASRRRSRPSATLLTSIFQANLAVIALQQNDVVRKISGWAAIIAVPTFMASDLRHELRAHARAAAGASATRWR